jgi:hypothetical protein
MTKMLPIENKRDNDRCANERCGKELTEKEVVLTMLDRTGRHTLAKSYRFCKLDCLARDLKHHLEIFDRKQAKKARGEEPA